MPKQYQGGRVARVIVQALYGKARLNHVLSLLGYTQINTSVVQRHKGPSRLRNQRKVRTTLAFKVPRYHRWMSWLAAGLYNFCRVHRSLTLKQERQGSQRSPAMAAKLTDTSSRRGNGSYVPCWGAGIIAGHYRDRQ